MNTIYSCRDVAIILKNGIGSDQPSEHKASPFWQDQIGTIRHQGQKKLHTIQLLISH